MNRMKNGLAALTTAALVGLTAPKADAFTISLTSLDTGVDYSTWTYTLNNETPDGGFGFENGRLIELDLKDEAVANSLTGITSTNNGAPSDWVPSILGTRLILSNPTTYSPLDWTPSTDYSFSFNVPSQFRNISHEGTIQALSNNDVPSNILTDVGIPVIPEPGTFYQVLLAGAAAGGLLGYQKIKNANYFKKKE